MALYGSMKRPFSQLGMDGAEPGSDKNKKLKPPPVPADDSTVFRILCPANNIKSVIGKDGKVINSLRQETRSKIIVPSGLSDNEERAIIIFSNLKESNEGSEFVCHAQDALLRVHNVIANAGTGDAKKDKVSARLLILKSQVGSLIGKGGSNVEKLRNESGAHIKVQRTEKMPSCAMSVDDLVEINGDPASVKKGLMMVSEFLHKHPPKENIPWKDVINQSTQFAAVDTPTASLYPPGGLLSQGATMNSLGAAYLGYGGYPADVSSQWGLPSSKLPLSSNISAASKTEASTENEAEEFCLKVLCNQDKIGSVIGKSGSTIKTMRQRAGSSIKVEDRLADCDERVIAVSAKEDIMASVSPVLEAILLLQEKVSRNGDKEGTFVIKIYVPSKQIGCLLGKGGNVIAEMRKKTRAHIKIFSKEERPKYVPHNEELVELTGDPTVIRDAIVEIVTRLRENFLKDNAKESAGSVAATSALGSLPIPGSYPYASSYASKYMPSALDGLGSTLGLSSFTGLQGGGYSSYPSSYSSQAYGSSAYSLPSTYASRKSELTIPGNAIRQVLGRDGTNLEKIRQVSGAQVTLHDPVRGTSDRLVEIAGLPDQVSQATSLIQAYITINQAEQLSSGARRY